MNALKSNDLAYREDSSNESMDFTRNRVRHVLIPMLERDFNPSVSRALRLLQQSGSQRETTADPSHAEAA